MSILVTWRHVLCRSQSGTSLDISLIELLQRSEQNKLQRFFARRLNSREDAAGALQETFLRLLSTTPRQDLRNPQAYLFQVRRQRHQGTVAARQRDAAVAASKAASCSRSDSGRCIKTFRYA